MSCLCVRVTKLWWFHNLRCYVTTYIYLSPLFKYNFEVFVMSISFLRCFYFYSTTTQGEILHFDSFKTKNKNKKVLKLN